MIHIGFNKPHITGKESQYIMDAVLSKKLSGNGKYTLLCQNYFQEKYGFAKCLLTTSCTDALEMAAQLIDVQAGDEIIMPSYTFVSTANAFVLRGAKIIFADSASHNPNIDSATIESLINTNTKAIVVVHYAGIACDMDTIMSIATKHNLYVIEDAAQAVDSYYINSKGEKQALGSIGHLAAFSFHETKNIISGEGGMLVINDKRFEKRAEIVWEKGTNRSAFFRGEVDKYGWVDIGSSFLPSEIIAVFLYAQLECLEDIQAKRIAIWNGYKENLKDLEQEGYVRLPKIDSFATNNGHMFYIICKSLEQRSALVELLKANKIQAVFHYLSLHKSHFFSSMHDGRELQNSDFFSDTLLRLPMYYDLEVEDPKRISNCVKSYFR